MIAKVLLILQWITAVIIAFLVIGLAIMVIEFFVGAFVELAKIIKDAFYYPISLQECIQLLMLIANYPVIEGDEYEELMSEAHKAVYIFHTATNHAGE